MFAPNPRGVVGVVDELLAACRGQTLQLEWRDGVCRARAAGGGGEATELPLPKSAFRAVLARLAALCNERVAESVSPYGGQGEVATGAGAFRVAFTNAPGEQRLELKHLAGVAGNAVPTPAPVEADDPARATSPGSA
jgi:hypothetical protein